ncbi:TetR family transcriptional regulator [Rhizobiales bacterium RZME27]|jgi:AcrR family transcriptional regulator|uniref:TetR family transcriptional regulator n=1 Tax=Endobacterium cereale TaxID=2663029 RepID=A0A6A8AJH6_9HYPH|nr:TetR family transcriptional regulator [Endobacterium cereale]MEB2845480.1 TetR family transcriptional regulator [Endobacterium cereale]MQY48891.1 TetR family transcriptional regulator [Endobacterium cereale]
MSDSLQASHAASANAADVRSENVERILDTAERLFRHYGYTKTNVADIAKELGMSPANIYRFFASKAEIHQALARRMLAASYDLAVISIQGAKTAADGLRAYALGQHRMTLETMLHENKVHEMVVIAIAQQWQVIEEHIERVRVLVADRIEQGIKAGEFRQQDADVASDCFMQATVALCHPQIIADCLSEGRRATPEDLVEFALRALR